LKAGGESVRILQEETAGETLDGYVNAVYKDVYARYLTARGVAVEWEGEFATAGALNPAQPLRLTPEQKLHLLRSLIDCHRHAIQMQPTLGLFSFSSGQFAKVEKVEVEKTRGLGHYVRVELTEFGSHR
jgi:hypothetical protein